MTEDSSEYKKPFDLKIILSAAIITIFLFGGGLFTGYFISDNVLFGFDNRVNDISSDINDFQLQFLFLDVLGEKSACPLLEETMKEINMKSYLMGSQIEEYKSGKSMPNENEYNILKKEYSKVLVNYWLLSKKMQDVCDLDADTIVYFFNNDYLEYTKQGFVLSYLKNKYDEKLLIFALDGDFEESSIEALKKTFNISEYPSLIINGKLYEGFYTAEELEVILND